MSGYKPDEKLRFDQLVKLRRMWLKDQELSHREPVLPPKTLGRMEKFWTGFLEPRSLWRICTYRTYNGVRYVLTTLLIPTWFVYYWVKYHIEATPHGILSQNTKLLPGDVILETGEVIPDIPEIPGHH